MSSTISVDGLPIDTYCSDIRLPFEERIELFKTLCSAVQSAHQNFVVHRDLKPSNILVTCDGDLKLLDFSIAKAVLPNPDWLSSETATGDRQMTLSYASPEQIRGEPVTAATDVHGLGRLVVESELMVRDTDGVEDSAQGVRLAGEIQARLVSRKVRWREVALRSR